jgi:hypothetical protein
MLYVGPHLQANTLLHVMNTNKPLFALELDVPIKAGAVDLSHT